jgi:uncharacterized protein with ParB-like and HNH nuclease domain
MEVHKRTPHEIFNMPQRLLVPLFQRPYVWSEEAQWEPLWEDIIRVASRFLANPQASHQPHFIGAVVLQQMPNSTGGFQERTIIDGQQRLTTLQILLDAMHAEFEHAGATKPAKRLERLIRNDEEFCSHPEDEFKVWPTNRDRPAFCEVMAAATPVDYNALAFKKDRLPQAHKYFSEQVRQWLSEGAESDISARADALETTARELLQIVVIDLAADENAQEIFETLNARGAQLSAADLIKNFIFQRLLMEGADTESAYEQDWKQFETAFWEKEVNIGRFTYPRAAVFLNHFLVARTGEVIGTQEVFSRFKTFASHESKLEMRELLRQVHSASKVYEEYTLGAEKTEGNVTSLELFSYRMSVLDTDSIKPLVLVLVDPELPPIGVEQLSIALNAVESYLIRRMIMSATTKNYNIFFTLLIAELRKHGRENAGTVVTEFLRSQNADFRYWPDDEQIRVELLTMPIFRKGRRLRMILEALEDHRRGLIAESKNATGEQRVIRGKLTLEHVLPQTWETNWPLLNDETEQSRRSMVHVLGNMTLLTQKLNSKVSNGAWLGKEGKAAALRQQSTLLLNRDLTEDSSQQWTTNAIAERTRELTESLLAVWGTPFGHKVVIKLRESRKRKVVSVADLLAAGLLEPGAIMRSTWTSLADRYGTILADGKIETDNGVIFNSLSGSGRHLANVAAVGGWHFWSIGEGEHKRLLDDFRNEYRERFEIDADTAEDTSESDE